VTEATEDRRELREAFLAGAERGLELLRQEARVRYHLRRLGLRLHEQHDGYGAVCRLTTACEYFAPRLDDIEAWARAQRAP